MPPKLRVICHGLSKFTSTGDAGVSNKFINADDLKNKGFDKAYFHWDCGR